MQVLACLMLGKTNREIGKDLSISESTVKAHVTSLFEKLKVSTRLKASVVAWDTFPMLRVLVRQRPAAPRSRRCRPSLRQVVRSRVGNARRLSLRPDG